MVKGYIKKCSNCYWCHQKEYQVHTGCYADGKWQKWILKKQLDIPTDCSNWKDIPETLF